MQERRHDGWRGWSIRTVLIGNPWRTVQALALALVLSSSAVGCGGTSGRAASQARASTPTTAAPAPTAPASTPTTTTPTTTTTATQPSAGGQQTTEIGGETQPGGGGDESGTASTVKLSLDGATVTPQEVHAPAFLQLQLDVRSADDRAHTVQVAFPTPVTVAVPAGGEASKLVPGARPGSYAVSVDGAVTDATVRLEQ